MVIYLFALATVVAQELLHEFNFNSYNGSGINRGGTNGRLDSQFVRVRLSAVTSESTQYNDSSPSASEFARGFIKFADRLNSSLIGSGGLGAIELTAVGDRALYLQQASTTLSPGYVEFRMPFSGNRSATAVNLVFEMDVAFSYLNRGARSSIWQLGYFIGSAAPNDSQIIAVPEGRIVTPQSEGNISNAWVTKRIALSFNRDVLPSDMYLFARITGVDGNGTGTRDAFAIDDINVLGYPCTPGQAQCKCGAGDACGGGLTCQNATCVKACMTNSLGCACGANDVCDSGLQCTSNVTSLRVCTVGGCTPGEPSCICTPVGTCSQTTCANGMCSALASCPNATALTAQCDEKCGSANKMICNCQAGVVNIVCRSTTMSSTAATTGGGGGNNSTTAATTAANGNSTAATSDVTTTMTTMATTVGTTTPAVNCATKICADCIAASADCFWCGNNRAGTCFALSSGQSCNFDPVMSVAQCPVNVIPTFTITVPSTDSTTVDSTAAGTTLMAASSNADRISATLLSTAFVIVVAALSQQ